MVLIFIENQQGGLKKASFEALTYGRKLAEKLGTTAEALVFNKPSNIDEVAKHGVAKTNVIENEALNTVDSQVYTKTIATVFDQLSATHLVLNHSSTGKTIAGRLSIRLKAGLVSGAKQLPNEQGLIEKSVFSGKAIAFVKIESSKQIISLMGNSMKPEAAPVDGMVEALAVEVDAPKVQIVNVDTVEGTVPLPEAELVVSAGRGMKGPENWAIIEELADILGATTACSRPVADSDWRPHHEHVGQTGVAIRPNLYIAIGISGAIQHLAGVNNSKTIVVVNKDPEAPFFKAADYGIVGDLFEVIPKLNQALKNFKNN